MQVDYVRLHQVQLGNPELPTLLSDLYFTRNPLHWKASVETSEDRSSRSYTVHDQFNSVRVQVDTHNGESSYSGVIRTGYYNSECWQLSADLAEKFYKRVQDQQEKWIKYSSKANDESNKNDETARIIEDIINLRTATDWKIKKFRGNVSANKASMTTLTSGDGCTRIQLIKYHNQTHGGQNRYTGKIYNYGEQIISSDLAERYFKQIQKQADKALELELRHLYEYDLETILSCIPRESWTISRRWSNPDDGRYEVGYYATCDIEVVEGKSSYELTTDISLDTRYDEQEIRLKLKRNGHKALISLPRDKHTTILNRLRAQFDLIPLHKKSSASTPTTESSRIEDLILSS